MKTAEHDISHWDDKFSSGEWGKYPPEELVRFMGRHYKKVNRAEVRVLEVGCGPGANLWFLHREGYRVSGIDGSPSATLQAKERIEKENKGLNINPPDLKTGNFSSLPWEDGCFDVVIDIFSIYANPIAVIEKTLSEVFRVLRPGGQFFCKLWGTKTTGFGLGEKIEAHTFDNIPSGPCANMGISHFFSKEEILKVYESFEVNTIDQILRTDGHTNSTIEELVCVFTKKVP